MADLADNVRFGYDPGQQPFKTADDDEIAIEITQ